MAALLPVPYASAHVRAWRLPRTQAAAHNWQASSQKPKYLYAMCIAQSTDIGPTLLQGPSLYPTSLPFYQPPCGPLSEPGALLLSPPKSAWPQETTEPSPNRAAKASNDQGLQVAMWATGLSKSGASWVPHHDMFLLFGERVLSASFRTARMRLYSS